MEWVGRAKIDFAASSSPLELREKGGKTTDLLRVCEAATPPCNLNPLLFNGHAQTIWTTMSPEAPQVHYKRKIFQATHPSFAGSYAVDFVVSRDEWSRGRPDDQTGDPGLPPRTANFTEEELTRLNCIPGEEDDGVVVEDADDERPMLVILHGLSGGSHEVYLRHAVNPMLESGRWEACVVNSRGCAGSRITTGILYNARATWDVRQTVNWLRRRYPKRPLFGLGFSLGACILTNYLGEEGDACPLKAAVVCANPWNLDVSGKALKRTFIGHEVYQRALGNSMRKLTAFHKDEITKYTNVDYEALQKLTYLYEFDRAYQCPTWGYPTEDAYYRDAQSVDAVCAIRVPTLALNAMDDPISNWQALPRTEVKTNPYTVLCTTSLGGHLGWFEIGGSRWNAKPVCNFLNHMAFEIDHDSIPSKKKGQEVNGTSAADELKQPPTVTAGLEPWSYPPGNYQPMRRRMYFHP